MSILFHAGKVLKDRNREVVREGKPGAKAIRWDTNGQPTDYAEEDKRDAVHGYVAIMALDSTLKSDQKELEGEPGKWVKAVRKREKIAEKIVAALNEGDGWVELDDDHRDVLVDRLAHCAVHMSNANIGPVVEALLEPPQKRPASGLRAVQEAQAS